MTVAALYVDPRGCYAGLEDVDLWDEARDARRYPGSAPVVAHPPCTRWCRLAGLVEARWGYRRGEDGGCFEAALAAVRRYGGVLEHPAFSGAWERYGIPKPRAGEGWRVDLLDPGAVCYVEQIHYGHKAKKATWLYAVGCELPQLDLSYTPDQEAVATVSWCGNHVKGPADRPRLSKTAASATPPRFRDILLAMARSVA